MLKYFSDQGGADHGGPLHWPGTMDGFPFRGDTVPNLRQQELETLPLALDYKSRSFKLWEPEDKAEFDVIMDRIVNGWYMQHKRFDNYVPEQNEYVVRLEWVQIYGEHPGSKNPGSGFDGRTQKVNLREATPQGGLLPAQPTRPPIQRQPGPVLGYPGPMGQAGTPY
jgi:hypothetical protein